MESLAQKLHFIYKKENFDEITFSFLIHMVVLLARAGASWRSSELLTPTHPTGIFEKYFKAFGVFSRVNFKLFDIFPHFYFILRVITEPLDMTRLMIISFIKIKNTAKSSQNFSYMKTFTYKSLAALLNFP